LRTKATDAGSDSGCRRGGAAKVGTELGSFGKNNIFCLSRFPVRLFHLYLQVICRRA
jgi:hypothetical protein